jgi:hypothetical protein
MPSCYFGAERAADGSIDEPKGASNMKQSSSPRDVTFITNRSQSGDTTIRPIRASSAVCGALCGEP